MALVVNVPLPVPPSLTLIFADNPETVPPVKLATSVAIVNEATSITLLAGSTVKSLNNLKLPVKILTSSSSKKSKTNNADIGKRRWLATHLIPVPHDENVMVVDSSEAKQQYALGPNHILIDDLPSNIAQWRAKGGTAIEHKNATDTINQLKQILGVTKESYGYSWSDV